MSKMASIKDLPDEVILKVTNFLELKDLARFGEVSKKMRIISSDQSLWKKINLSKNKPGFWSYEIDVPTDFLKMAIENGCQYLSLRDMKLGNSGEPISMTSEGDLWLDKYLDLNYCDAHVLTFEEILASCHSLEKLSMASKLSKQVWKRKFITSKMIQSICYQNGPTLQTLNLSCCIGLDLESIQNITKHCAGLKNVDLLATRLSEDSINFLVNNLTPEVEKLSLGCLVNLKDDQLKTLVSRCNKLSILNLSGNRYDAKITNDSLTHIIENLQPTLEKLDISWCNITYADLTELKSMPKLRVLTCNQYTFLIQNLKKSLPLVRLGETICVDERKLSPADGIWNVEAKQFEYFRKSEKCQFDMLPNEIITRCSSFLERRDLIKFGQVAKRMRFITCNMSNTSCQCQISPCVHTKGDFTYI